MKKGRKTVKKERWKPGMKELNIGKCRKEERIKGITREGEKAEKKEGRKKKVQEVRK